MISLKKLLAGEYDEQGVIHDAEPPGGQVIRDAEPPRSVRLPVIITYKDWQKLLLANEYDEKQKQLLLELIKQELR